MSVENLNIIDFISTDKNGDVVLTISDYLEWDKKDEHLILLQNKLNAYLDFIGTGQLEKNYPHKKNKNIIISVVAKYSPNQNANAFLKAIEEKIKSFGYSFVFSIQS